jgi:hypothetical protein
MFGKKPAAAAPAPQPQPTRSGGMAVQILTPDYVIGGFLPPMETPLLGFLNLPGQASVTLSKCKLLALNPQIVVASDVPEITIPKTTIISVVPRDEAGARSAMLNLPAVSKRTKAYAGPYVIQSNFRLISDSAYTNLFSGSGGNLFVVTEAEIRCTVPGSKFTELKVPGAVLNRQFVQLYHVV